MLVGAALGARDEVIAIADALQAGCAKALLGKAALSDELPWVTGTIGLLGSARVERDDGRCDTLLLVGTNYPYDNFCRKPIRCAACRSTSTVRAAGHPFPVVRSEPSGRRAQHAASALAISRP